MGQHQIRWDDEAEHHFDGDLPSPLSSTWYDSCLLCVEDDGQLSEDADECTWRSDPGSNNELHLNITEADAVPPVLRVVRGPDQWVDEAEKIVEQDPEDQDRCCKVVGLDMCD